MMLNIIRKILSNKNLFLLLILFFASCQKKEIVIAEVYKKNNKISKYDGVFYAAKYGGLNYYALGTQKREELLKLKDVDSIIFIIDAKNYIAKPLQLKSFTKDKNSSDFSFFVDKIDSHIIVDTLGNLTTVLIFSEKTDIEILKEKGIIKAQYIDR